MILAAGRGTRLGELTADMPKPMVSVAGKPALEHIVDRIARAGVREFVFVVRYKAERIVDYFGDGSKMGLKIEYAEQPDRYGTGAALLAARERVGDSPLLMTYGDVVTASVSYADALRIYAENSGAGVAILNEVPDGYAGSRVEIDGSGRMLQVVEKPPRGISEVHWNCVGVFVFSSVVFDYLERLRPSARGEYELADAMNAMIADGHRFGTTHLRGFWRDIGSIEGIADAERLLLSGDE